MAGLDIAYEKGYANQADSLALGAEILGERGLVGALVVKRFQICVLHERDTSSADQASKWKSAKEKEESMATTRQDQCEVEIEGEAKKGVVITAKEKAEHAAEIAVVPPGPG